MKHFEHGARAGYRNVMRMRYLRAYEPKHAQENVTATKEAGDVAGGARWSQVGDTCSVTDKNDNTIDDCMKITFVSKGIDFRDGGSGGWGK